MNAMSPLLGGKSAASKQFSFNWGEGNKQVAEALMTIDGIEEMTVMGGLWPETIDIYLPFPIEDARYAIDRFAAEQWQQRDVVILTFPEVQRQLYPEPLRDWFEMNPPDRTVYDELGVYARIYVIRNKPLPDAFANSRLELIVTRPISD
jgi:hypothetical protein